MLYIQVRSFLRRFFRVGVAVLILGVFIVLGYNSLRFSAETLALSSVDEKVQALQSKVVEFEKKEETARLADLEFLRIISLTLNAMEISRSPLSTYQRTSMAALIAQTAVKRLPSIELRNAWIATLAIESAFSPDAKSSAGARGVGQVTPPTASDFSLRCGFQEKLDAHDLNEPVVNLNISACLFNLINERVNGSVALTLVAYNAGLYSKSLKSLEALTAINTETANYVAKHTYLLEMLNK